MTEQKKHDIKRAYQTLCHYMLWRRDRVTAPPQNQDIRDALEIATGCLLDYLALDTELAITENSLEACESALGATQKENARYRAILARHKIKHARGIE